MERINKAHERLAEVAKAKAEGTATAADVMAAIYNVQRAHEEVARENTRKRMEAGK